MSEQVLIAIIGSTSGLVGIMVGALLSYNLQLRLERRRRNEDARQAIRNQLTDGVSDFAEWMRKHGTEFMPSETGKGGLDWLTRLGQVLFLFIFLAVILVIFIPTIRSGAVEFFLSLPLHILGIFVLVIGFIGGWTLIRSSQNQ